MEIWGQRQNIIYSRSPLRRATSFLLLVLGTAFVGQLCANSNYREAAAVAAVSLGAAFLLAAPISIEAVLLAWFTTTPLASFYIRFPTDRSIITFNRVVLGLVILMLIVSYRLLNSNEEGFSLTRFEIAWAILSVVALASAMTHSNNVAYATRIAIDTFWLPIAAFYVARRHFDLKTGGRLLLLGCMGVALFLFVTGAVELATGIDLFQYKGAELVREGERRVNGPFAADSSFAIVCLILFLFLQAAPKLINARFDRSGRLLYVCATVAAAFGALLSLFRVVALALIVAWIAQRFLSRRDPREMIRIGLRRLLPVGTLLVLILILLGAWLVMTDSDRAVSRLINPRSVFGRVATWMGAAEIAVENPVRGVGLTNYAEHYDASHYYSDEAPEEVLDTKAAASPHSNLLWIAAELGVPAGAVYVVANLCLFLLGWRALRRPKDKRRRIAAACFVSLVLAYWIPGLTLASGYYSDLNLYLFFLLGALSTQFSRPTGDIETTKSDIGTR